MKKLIFAVVAVAVVGMSVQTARAGDREWATVGKVLTGVAAGAVIARAVDGGPTYVSASYGYGPGYSVAVAAPAPCPPPAPVVYAPAPVCYAPAPVVYVAPRPVYYAPPVYVSYGYYGRGYGHGHGHYYRGCR